MDSGADQTVIPLHVAERLGVPPLDVQTVKGFDGTPQSLPTFAVRLQIRDLPPIVVEVIGSEHVRDTILGRDVLNRYVVTLDGPNQRLEIRDA